MRAVQDLDHVSGHGERQWLRGQFDAKSDEGSRHDDHDRLHRQRNFNASTPDAGTFEEAPALNKRVVLSPRFVALI